MSCPRCEASQDPELDRPPGQYFVRVGNGNVELVGCPEHVQALIDLVRAARDERV